MLLDIANAIGVIAGVVLWFFVIKYFIDGKI
jgi:hypothetical protein